MSEDGLDMVFDSIRDLVDLRYQLGQIASAHYTLHQFSMGDKLANLCNEMEDIENRIRKGTVSMVNSSYEQAERATANMISACLATNKINSED